MSQTLTSDRLLFWRRLAPFLLFVPILVAAWVYKNATIDEEPPSTRVDSTSVDAGAKDIAKSLYGLWAKKWPSKMGDSVRFYYFHKPNPKPAQNPGDASPANEGIGLYRYGKLGLNHTHSYTWKILTKRVDDVTGTIGGELLLRFNKTGELRKTYFTIAKNGKRFYLKMMDDPRDDPFTQYEKELRPPPSTNILGLRAQQTTLLQAAVKATSGTMTTSSTTAESVLNTMPFDRMWMHVDAFKKGGIEFRLYQFQNPALDGRGVGWFHRGDFDNWSTEMLTYRVNKQQIELHFVLRNEDEVTSMRFLPKNGKRLMVLGEDPRNFWQKSDFLDGGKSFIAENFGMLLHK